MAVIMKTFSLNSYIKTKHFCYFKTKEIANRLGIV